MTVSSWLKQSQRKLEAADISTARLDCLVLLEDQAGHDRSWLLAHPEYELQIELVKILNKKITQRAKHEPLAYIRGKTEFYAREFYIDHRILEPRPESETMIDMLKALSLPDRLTIIDIGTGSGALAVTAKLEIPAATVLATDIDPACLDVASQNARKFKADIQLLQGDLLDPILNAKHEPLVLLCNLPYVPDSFRINPAAMREPRIAIFGGPDGLDLYRRLFRQIKSQLKRPTYLLTESMPPQHEALTTIASSAGYKLEKTNDFIQLFRKDRERSET